MLFCSFLLAKFVCWWFLLIWILSSSLGGTLLPHQSPYATFPFGQPPQIIPAVSPLTPRPSPFGFPPIFYWPYPSPPVSPTNYYGAPSGSAAAAAAAAAAAVSAAAGGVGMNNGSGLPGTLVIMRGLPFNATKSDILQFFQGFSEVRGFLLIKHSLLSFSVLSWNRSSFLFLNIKTLKIFFVLIVVDYRIFLKIFRFFTCFSADEVADIDKNFSLFLFTNEICLYLSRLLRRFLKLTLHNW